MSCLTGKTILIVDDEAFLREALREEVEAMGGRGLEAENGAMALGLLKTERVDVVVSDLRMAGGSGLELLQQTPIVHTPCPPFLLLTGATDIDTPELHALGAWAILEKPVSLLRLRAELEKAACDPRTFWDGSAGIAAVASPASALPLSLPLPSIEEAITQGMFRPGRGGFFLKMDGGAPAWGARVKFQLDFANGPLPRFAGTAIVRWTRTEATEDLPAGCGLEIDSLEANSLPAWDLLASRLSSPSFIPKK